MAASLPLQGFAALRQNGLQRRATGIHFSAEASDDRRQEAGGDLRRSHADGSSNRPGQQSVYQILFQIYF